MKVLYLLGGLNRGGKEVLIRDILSNYKVLPFDALCVYRKEGNMSSDFLSIGAQVKKISLKPIVSFLKELRQCVLREKVDIIHAQSSFDAMLSVFATMGLKVKVIQTIHGLDESKKKKLFNLQKLMMQFCSKTVFVSNYQRRFYVEKYKLSERVTRKTCVIYNGVDFSKFDRIYDEVHLPKCYEKGLRLITVGNFVAGRRHLLICKFLKLLSDASVSFDFYFVGKKDPAQEWRYDECYSYCNENSLLDRVHFLGSRDDVPALLKQMDAFIYSSDADTFGIAVVEAIYSGVPVFVNDFAVMKEITLDGKLATLYQSGNENDLLEKFLNSIDSFENKVVDKNIQTQGVASVFSIDNHINSLNTMYNSLNM